MGLRFRKSISLGKGIRLNIGKTGVSISAGIPGFRKTIHSSGRVTTSVGIPGTGIYYVDTKNPKKKETTAPKKTSRQASAYTWNPTPQPVIQIDPKPVVKPTDRQLQTEEQQDVNVGLYARATGNSTVTNNSVHTQSADTEIKSTAEQVSPIPDVKWPSTVVTQLFEHCDYPVKWIDVLTSAQPLDSAYNPETWQYLHSKAIAVFEGDVEAMLEIIERINPYDDLLDHLTDFEFEADDAECIEVICRLILNSLGSEKEDAIASLIIRLARDTFALLPIPAIRIHILNAPSEIIDDVYFERDIFANTIFENKDPSSLLFSLSRNRV